MIAVGMEVNGCGMYRGLRARGGAQGMLVRVRERGITSGFEDFALTNRVYGSIFY